MAIDGIDYYAEATVKIFFPDGQVCCDHCPLMETYSRKQCRRTGEYLLNTKSIGMYCPLIINDEIKEFKKYEKI